MPVNGRCTHCGEQYELYTTPIGVAVEATAEDYALQPHLCRGTLKAKEDEVSNLQKSLTRVVGEIQKLQLPGSPIPGDELTMVEWIVKSVQERVADNGRTTKQRIGGRTAERSTEGRRVWLINEW